MSLGKKTLVGADTSFLLRLLIGKPETQFEKAQSELDYIRGEGKQVGVSDLVISELYFALQYHYGVSKKIALDKIRQMLESPEFLPMGKSLEVLQTANLAKTKPGFVDRMIHGHYIDNTQEMLTFEKAAIRLPAVKVL
ncbi:MAG: hypothetical protein JJT75_01730 [Opitutales bacterium]|nr:hypothetical protein [Opitutales bacterium]MCH8541799.1 hypothetical protein [Opitutales bacterium]